MALHEVLTYLRVLQQTLPAGTSQPAHLYHSDDQMGPQPGMWCLSGSLSRSQLIHKILLNYDFKKLKKLQITAV